MTDLSASRQSPSMDAPPSPPSLTALYDAELGYVWNSLRRLGVRGADLEDVAQDVFVVVQRRLDSYDATRPLRPWLFGIAYRVAHEHFRRAYRHRELADDARLDAEPGELPTGEEVAEASRSRALVRCALQHVETERRAVFIMHDLDGTPVPEIAAALAIPLNTAYSRLRLARQDFRSAVARLRPQGGLS